MSDANALAGFVLLILSAIAFGVASIERKLERIVRLLELRGDNETRS